MNVKLINKGNQPNPEYKTPESAGMDLRADIPKDSEIVLAPLQRVLIPTGLYIQLPKGYEAQVRPRSGFAINYGITVLNTPGTVDSDYRGEIKVILVNLSNESFTITSGMRIAQLVIAKHEYAEFEIVDNLDKSERADGGIGHTGLN